MSGGPAAEPARVEGWLRELGLEPRAAAVRDGVASWDLVCDGRRRPAVPVTVIVAPGVACVLWVHYAPPLGDSFRRSYRRLLRWNDELPYVKFALAEDERPILAAELPLETLDRDRLGEALARLLAVCDLLVDETEAWIWPGGRRPPGPGAATPGAALIDRYAARLGELAEPPTGHETAPARWTATSPAEGRERDRRRHGRSPA